MKTTKIKKTAEAKKAMKSYKITKTRNDETTKTTTLFMNGQSQAVRLPKEFRLNGKKVYIKKRGNCIILIPIPEDPWKLFFESLNEFSDDFFPNGREILPNQERDWSCFK